MCGVGTNLGKTRTATENTITSSTGTNATLTAATATEVGLMTAADRNKLNGIANGAGAGTVTTVSALAPCVSNGSTTVPIISFGYFNPPRTAMTTTPTGNILPTLMTDWSSVAILKPPTMHLLKLGM